MTRTLPIASLVAAIATFTVAGCMGDKPDAAPAVPKVTAPTTTTAAPITTTSDPKKSTSRPARFSSAGSSRLRFFAECPDLLAYMQDEATKRVTSWGLGSPGWGGYYRGGGPVPMMDAASAAGAAPAGTVAPAAAAAPADAATNFSGTNTQEVGVDEGDIVETDGTHVFVASQDGVRIVDVASAQVIAKLDIPDGSHQLLLDGTRLLVATQPYTGVDTVVSLYDVSDAAAPTLLHRTHLEGRLIATRAIGGTARLVLTASFDARLPFVHPDMFGFDENRAVERNKEIIAASTVDDWMPRSFDEASDGTFGAMSTTLDCSSVAAPRDFAGLGVSWIASIDLQGSGESVGSAGIVSNSDTVYASENNMYLATVPWDWNNQPQVVVPPNPTMPPTLIHEFSLGQGGTASYVASGEVPGQLLNQFSMSEFGGDLRVAMTTTSFADQQQNSELSPPSPTSSSAVRVLRPEGNELVQIGSVGGLGNNEQIQAVRFLGTQAYVVTFHQTDPLFVVDLSDPTAPVVSGELKIPGYSAYLHPVGDGLLLGIGQDATDQGRVLGTQLSLFDVHDPANPVQLSTLPIGGSSDAEWDHHAFLYWPEDGTIVLPVSPGWNNCGIAPNCLAGTLTNPVGGVIVAQLDGTTLTARGTISSKSSAQDQGGCWNPLQRSLAIGTELVTVGMNEVEFSDRATLTPRDSVHWGDPQQYGCVWYAN